MPNNRVKTTKALQSQKGNASLSKLHPHSRRAKQLTRIALRSEKLASCKKERRKTEMSKINRFLWFFHALESNLGSSTSYSIEQVHELIIKFIDRHSNQIQSEQSQRRPGRPKSQLQERLEVEVEFDQAEYSSTGFVVPDLTSPQNVILLKQWSTQHQGDPSFLPRIKLIRLFKSDLKLIVEDQHGAVDKIDHLTSEPSSPS